MATVITTKKNKKEVNNTPAKAPLFRKMNFILMGAGALILIIGFFCLKGGAVADVNTFDGEIFNTRRLVVAPVLIVLGLLVEVVAIMWHPCSKKETPETPAE